MATWVSLVYTNVFQCSKGLISFFQESYDRAKTILKNNQTQHKALAQALLKYETLDADEIRCVVEGKKLHRPLTPVYPAAGNKMNPQATKQPLLS